MVPLTPQERRVALFVVGAAIVGALVIGYQRTIGARQPLVMSQQAASWEAAAERVEPTQPLSINRASERELARLPGIGPSLAARIVADREEHGSFLRVEDLERVRGIGPKLVERLRARVTVE